MTRMTMDKAKKNFSDTIRRVSRRGGRVAISDRGKVVAAVVSADDLALLERLEDAGDVEDAQKALAEMEVSGEKPIPYEEYRRKRLGS